MKLIRLAEGDLTVEYFGITISGVPRWGRSIATDEDGMVFVYEAPKAALHVAENGSWLANHGAAVHVADVDLEGMDFTLTAQRI